MIEARTTPAKHIFLDVVGFTRARSVEAQTDIVGYLNSIVSGCLGQHDIPVDQRILLPTGDGLCIVLLNIEDPYDIHIQLALSILDKLHQHNADRNLDESRKFMIRIGINANTDNLVTDINGRLNIAGRGINVAQRVMDKADGGQILVSQAVYETLQQREKYMNLFEGYVAKTKHGENVNVYQLLLYGRDSLNTDTPSAFEVKVSERKLPKLVAHYFAHANNHRNELLSNKDSGYEYSAVVLLYLRSIDSVEQSASSEVDETHFAAHGEGKATFSEQLAYYKSQDFWTIGKLSDFIKRGYLSDFSWCFERRVGGIIDYRFVNSSGLDKLRNDWPEVLKSFQLAESAPTDD